MLRHLRVRMGVGVRVHVNVGMRMCVGVRAHVRGACVLRTACYGCVLV